MGILFETAVADTNSNTIIFPAWDYDMIYCLDITTNKISCLEGYEPEGIFPGPKYGAVCKYKDELLIFAPLRSKRIFLYQIKGKKGTYIELERSNNQENLFFGAVVIGDCAYFMPGRYDSFVKLNVHTYDVSYYGRDVVKEIVKNNSEKICVRHGICVKNEYLWVVGFNTNRLVKIDVNNDFVELIALKGDIKFTSVVDSEEKDNLLLLGSKGDVYKYNIVSGKLTMYLRMNTWLKKDDLFTEIVKTNNNIFIFPLMGEGISALMWDEKNRIVIKIRNSKESRYLCVYVFFDKLYAFNHIIKQMEIIDMEMGKIINSVEIDDTDCQVDFFIKHAFFYDGILLEKGKDTLKQYIQNISREQKRKER